MKVEFCFVYTDTIETSAADDMDLNVNQLYTSTGVTISNPLPVTRENSYIPHMPRLAANRHISNHSMFPKEDYVFPKANSYRL